MTTTKLTRGRPRTVQDVLRLERALYDLKSVRAELALVGCPGTLRKVRSAIKSVEGALRNARRFEVGT